MAVMSPAVMMNSSTRNLLSHCTPPQADAVDRHEYGINKHRKSASTGGGRAWSDDEEVYLLQTRLQKMPYKHIAAHLKKTELACRLHYHQLSHGSNRRKRTTSVSSCSSGRSPIMHASIPSPIHEQSDPTTPESYTQSYSPASPSHVQLPSASALLAGSITPPRPVAILPKPSPTRSNVSTPPLQLDCAISFVPAAPSIDKDRLNRIYEFYRVGFWNNVAAEYGEGVNPLLLEDAWRRGGINAPPTPCISPSSNVSYHKREERVITGPSKAAATSISALLGIDASPRSPQEREMIRRMEESGRMDMA